MQQRPDTDAGRRSPRTGFQESLNLRIGLEFGGKFLTLGRIRRFWLHIHAFAYFRDYMTSIGSAERRCKTVTILDGGSDGRDDATTRNCKAAHS